MDSSRPSASPETRARLWRRFSASRTLPTSPRSSARCSASRTRPTARLFSRPFLARTRAARRRPHFRPSSPGLGDLAMGGSTDGRMFAIGVEEARKEADKWKSTQTWDTAGNAKILRKSMERDHVVFGPGEQPHHLVQGADRRAAESRALLDKYHIDINGAENGIKLTRRIHQTSGLQRTKAIKDLTARLRQALRGAKSWEAGRDSIMKELGRTRRDINAGDFPCP